MAPGTAEGWVLPAGRTLSSSKCSSILWTLFVGVLGGTWIGRTKVYGTCANHSFGYLLDTFIV